MQAAIDFVLRNRRFIGGCVVLVGICLHAVPVAWCRVVAEVCTAAGAYIHGSGLDTSDRKSEVKQAIRDGEIPERRAS
jgi:hypothetical protein